MIVIGGMTLVALEMAVLAEVDVTVSQVVMEASTAGHGPEANKHDRAALV